MDANYTFDQKLGYERISLEDLVMDEETKITLKFGEVRIIFINFMKH